jgi:hypothetical protein
LIDWIDSSNKSKKDRKILKKKKIENYLVGASS